jgi:hypothetical protein
MEMLFLKGGSVMDPLGQPKKREINMRPTPTKGFGEYITFGIGEMTDWLDSVK